MTPRAAVDRLLVAIESRDLRQIAASLTIDARWQNVPHQPAIGRDAVIDLLATIITWSDRVEWEVVSSAVVGDSVLAERIDRFWMGGDEHAVRCNGVFEVDPGTQLVSAVRDYVDIGEWRARIGPVYERMAARSTIAVVERHLAAVGRCDVASMAADYALDATLVRGGDVFNGWFDIAGYFDSVPDRLAACTLEFADVAAHDDETTVVSWVITREARRVAAGTDTYRVQRGRIVEQVVRLDGADF